MKTLGIIGGIGPESTIDYYKYVVAIYRERIPDGSYPALIINSIDLQPLIRMMTTRALAEATEYLVTELGRLQRAGAEFGIISANTPHIVFDEVQQRSPIPLISIVEAAADATKARGLRRVLLMGTKFTMGAGFYSRVFATRNIDVVLPSAADQDYIHTRYMGELVLGVLKDETRNGLRAIIERLVEQDGVEGVILGGTELPLILRDSSHAGVPLLDTAHIHAAAAVERMISEGEYVRYVPGTNSPN